MWIRTPYQLDGIGLAFATLPVSFKFIIWNALVSFNVIKIICGGLGVLKGDETHPDLYEGRDKALTIASHGPSNQTPIASILSTA